jgi:hypothetical protein
MSIKFGEIDASQILENEYRIGVLEGMVDWILTNNPTFVKDLTDEDIDEIRRKVVNRLQQKYPKSAIALRRE